MSEIISYINCPVCGSSSFKSVLSAKDYTVSNELFEIVECENCSLRFTQNVPDENAIQSYYKSENYISHSDTSKGFINTLYKRVRKKTLKEKRKLIENSTGLKKGSILDVGSGTGAFANEMKEAGWSVTGLEPDEDARKVASEVHKIELSDIIQFYSLAENSFDAITMWHVLEHVHDLEGYMSKLRSILKERGKLFVAVPNYTSKDAAIYKDYWAAYDVPRHLYHFSPRSMKILVEKHEMKIEQYKPMWFDSFYVSMLSSKYMKGKTNLLTSFINGLRSNLQSMKNTQQCSSVIYIISK